MTTDPIPHAQAAAFSAYRRSSWWERFVPGLFVLALLLPAFFLAARPSDAVGWALLALGGALTTAFFGRDMQQLALPAVVAGVCPLACGLMAGYGGHVCIGGTCSTLCIPACTASGFVAGALLGRLWKRRHSSTLVVLVTGLVTWSVGSLGCSCAGNGGLWGMTLGLIAGASLGSWLARPPAPFSESRR